MTIWAVVYGNYDPPEVLALYDNEPAAAAHAASRDRLNELPYEIVPMSVLSEYRPEAP